MALKKLVRYEARDGVSFDTHEEALRHDTCTALPVQLADHIQQAYLERYQLGITAQNAKDLAMILMGDTDFFLARLREHDEQTEALGEYAAKREARHA